MRVFRTDIINSGSSAWCRHQSLVTPAKSCQSIYLRALCTLQGYIRFMVGMPFLSCLLPCLLKGKELCPGAISGILWRSVCALFNAMALKLYRVYVKQHTPSIARGLQDEPQLIYAWQHRIGYRKGDEWKPELAHAGRTESCATISSNRSLQCLQMRNRKTLERRPKIKA